MSSQMNQPLLPRNHWMYLPYEDFISLASTLPPMSFEPWVPEAVIDEGKKLYAETVKDEDPETARALLSKLISDRRMDRVWKELYKKRRVEHESTKQFWRPIYMTHSSIAAENRRRASELMKGNLED
jgi:hypothetical protein